MGDDASQEASSYDLNAGREFPTLGQHKYAKRHGKVHSTISPPTFGEFSHYGSGLVLYPLKNLPLFVYLH